MGGSSTIPSVYISAIPASQVIYLFRIIDDMQQAVRADEQEAGEVEQQVFICYLFDFIVCDQLTNLVLFFEQQFSFRKIEELENYSVARTDIVKLKAGGYHTIESVQ